MRNTLPMWRWLLGGDDDPKLSLGVFDAVLVSNSYHEFAQPVAMLRHLCEALKQGGYFWCGRELFDRASWGQPFREQTKLHDIAPELLQRELAAEGLKVKERIDRILVERADRFRYLFAVEKSK